MNGETSAGDKREARRSGSLSDGACGGAREGAIGFTASVGHGVSLGGGRWYCGSGLAEVPPTEQGFGAALGSGATLEGGAAFAGVAVRGGRGTHVSTFSYITMYASVARLVTNVELLRSVIFESSHSYQVPFSLRT